MTSRVLTVVAAYAAFGLEPGAGLIAAKRAFRERVKTLHPDTTEPTPEALSRLAAIVDAIRFLEKTLPACMEIGISAHQARQGLTRSLRSGDRAIIVRIPPGVTDGACLQAVGEPDTTVQVRVLAATNEPGKPPAAPDFEPLDDFVEAFSRPSANARFARWIRKAQSAA
ncbi:J domain-containing protein [uncultured Maricaulis sp.]|uniref:J domain-containing protein n=1 Tax=uncultured Maricaulis sp. TaxID=174710 RepID=UPI0030DD4D5C|tara:strand:- start:60479 stop:60985 length:507 start_codon:yes stop_codon:yes gene_type:complete